MKKILKKLIYQIKNTKLITKVFLIILLLVGGGLTANHFVQKEYMIKVAKDHQKEMDEQVRYGDKNHHIKTITYEWDTVERNPMDGFMLNGYVNGDKNLDFGISFDSDNGGKSIYCYEYTCAEQLDNWTKDGN